MVVLSSISTPSIDLSETPEPKGPRDRGPRGPWVKYYYDAKDARRAVRFVEKQLIHVEGKHAGNPFKLEWWEKRAMMRFFGWKRRENGKRRYRVLFIFIPRKNGKTALIAAICLYLQFADREAAAQVVCAAADKDQANFVFGMASNMVKANPILNGRANVWKTSIFIPSTNSVFKVLSKKPNTKHGANIHCAAIDEVHAIEDRELVDVLTTGMIARTQPVTLYASTAGFDKTHFFYGLYQYAKKVAENPSLDESFMPIIYEADPDKWQDPEEWKRVNPNFGVTMDLESFQADFRMAQEIPHYENTFKRLRLNIWTEQDARVIPMEKWDLCNFSEEEFPLKDLERQECFAGLDLAYSNDLAAFCLLFPPTEKRPFYDVLMHYWFPELNIPLRKKRLHLDVTPWVDSGHLTLTPGNVIDYDRIRATVNQMGRLYRIREIAIDPWNAVQLSTQLAEQDLFTVVPTRPYYSVLSDPTKQLLSLILEKKLNTRLHPLLRWNATNLGVEEDHAGNIRPSRKKSVEKIDGIVALIMALSRALPNVGNQTVYADRGIRVIG